MTAAADIPNQPHRVEPVVQAPKVLSSHDTKAFSVAVGSLLVIFLLLQNQYWVPGGDSEVYTGAARSLLQGHGYRFSGVPVSIVPPGWSFVLAGAMKISPTFLFLKLLTMSCMLGSLAIMYWICRRFASPNLSATVVILSGIVSHVYSLTFWLHSDALFCLLSSAALLLAFQINEGRASWGRAITLILLCAGAVSVRWAGLLSTLLACAVLLHGELIPKFRAPMFRQRWVLAALCGVLTLGTFLAIRNAIRVSAAEKKEILEAIGGDDSGFSGAGPDLVATTYAWINPAHGGWGYLARAAGWGNWFSYLIWQPFRIRGPLTIPGLLAGWTVLLPLILLGLNAIQSRRWIWVGLLLYSFALALNWPHPVARYLVPVTPLILLGVFTGFPLLFTRNRLLAVIAIYCAALVILWNAPGNEKWWMLAVRPALVIAISVGCFFVINRIRQSISDQALAGICRGLLAGFVVTLVVCNGALWAVDVYVARAKDFYEKYEAGLNRDLVAASFWLHQHPVNDHEVAVSRRYVNMGRAKTDSVLGLRVTAMLIDRAVIPVPDQYVKPRRVDGVQVYGGDPRRNQNFLAWARQIGVKYVLYQPDVSPWRVFHFRMGWLQKYMTGERYEETTAGWRMYEIPDDGDAAKTVVLDTAASRHWPTRVPGL